MRRHKMRTGSLASFPDGLVHVCSVLQGCYEPGLKGPACYSESYSNIALVADSGRRSR
jgi:hypothetical protein